MKLTRVTKHHTLIIFLHWSMALTLLVMVLTGEFMEDSLNSPIFVLHTQVGLTLLLLFFVRLSTSLITHRTHNVSLFSKVEERIANVTKFGLYAVMFLIPFTGWLMTNFELRIQPTSYLEVFDWPVIPSVVSNHEQFEILEEIHEFGVNMLFLLTGLHVIGYIKHLVWNKVDLLHAIRFKNSA
jgi:cytochrome b561